MRHPRDIFISMFGQRSSMLRRICASALLCVFAAPAAGSAVTVDFFDHRASSEAVLSEMALHPASIAVDDVVYIAYQGVGYDPYVVAYDTRDGSWSGPVRAGTNPLRLDTHGAPSLYEAADGRLHVLYGGHNRPLYHARTAEPGDISRWETLPVLADVATYPQVIELADGRVALFYRTSGYDWVLRLSDASRATFDDPEPVLSGGPDTWWYADFRPGSDGSIHAAFVWNDYLARFDGTKFTRHNVYYMRRDHAGGWRDVSDDPVATPLDKIAADESVLVFDSGDELCNEITVNEDDTGAPCILFLAGSGAGESAYEWRYLRRSFGGWLMTGVTTADHFFDSGAFRPGQDGDVEAFLVTGTSGAEGGTLSTYRGRGGSIVRWLSGDYGMTWTREETITPAEPESAFGDPHYVLDGSGRARLVFVEWNDDETNFFNRMYLWGEEGRVTRDVGSNVTRLAGKDRASTSVAVSRASFPEGARTVVIATGSDYPDALAGAPLAEALGAPLLLASRAGVSLEVREEIKRLGATKAVLLGGAAALGVGVESDLYDRTSITSLERLAGADRYETSLAIARRLKAHDPGHDVDVAFVVSGENWPDATTVAPLAAVLGAPIVLTQSRVLSPDASTILEEWETVETIVVGGERVVGAQIFDTLPGATRVAGVDRYATAAAMAQFGLSRGLLPYRVVVATGENFPDALTGGGLAARVRGPVILSRKAHVPTAALGYLGAVDDRLFDAYLIGSDTVIGSEVATTVADLME